MIYVRKSHLFKHLKRIHYVFNTQMETSKFKGSFYLTNILFDPDLHHMVLR